MLSKLEALGCEPFSYDKRGKTIIVGRYVPAPDAVIDNGDALLMWASRTLNSLAQCPPHPQTRNAHPLPPLLHSLNFLRGVIDKGRCVVHHVERCIVARKAMAQHAGQVFERAGDWRVVGTFAV